jgi:hypothetical protein
LSEAAVDGVSFEIAVGVRVPMIRSLSGGLLIGGGVTVALRTILLSLALRSAGLAFRRVVRNRQKLFEDLADFIAWSVVIESLHNETVACRIRMVPLLERHHQDDVGGAKDSLLARPFEHSLNAIRFDRVADDAIAKALNDVRVPLDEPERDHRDGESRGSVSIHVDDPRVIRADR